MEEDLIFFRQMEDKHNFNLNQRQSQFLMYAAVYQHSYFTVVKKLLWPEIVSALYETRLKIQF